MNISRACIGSNEYIGEFYGRPLTVDYVDLLNVKHGEGFLFDNAFIGDGPLETSALAKIRANKEIYMNRLKDITELNYAHLELSPEIVQLLSQANPEVVPTMAKLLENIDIQLGDIVEIVGGPFKGERGKVKRLNKQKSEVIVELLDAIGVQEN